MKNLRKFLAVLVVVTILATAMVPAFAEDTADTQEFSYENEAQTLHDLGLYNGTSETEFVADLGLAVDRETAIVMLVRMLGFAEAAQALTDDAVAAALANYTDASKISDWAKKEIAFAVQAGMVKGTSETTIGPKAPITGRELATLILRAMGYKDGVDFNWTTATGALAEKGGLTAEEAVAFNNKALIRDDLVGIVFGALKAEDPDGVTVIEKLVKAGVVDKQAAVDAGVLDNSAELEAAAEAAVAAYEKAPITTLVEVTAAEKLEAPATDAVALVLDATKAADFNKRIADAKAKVVAAKTDLSTFKVLKAEAVGAKLLKLTFNQKPAAGTTIDVKLGYLPVAGTVAYDATGTIATFTSTDALVAGTYTATITGIKDPVSIAFAAPAVASFDIASKALLADAPIALGGTPANNKINLTVLSQYGEAIAVNPSNFTVTAFNTTTPGTVACPFNAANGNYDLGAVPQDANILISVVYKPTGAAKTATIKVSPFATIAKINVTAPAPIAGQSRISVSTVSTPGDTNATNDLVLPLTFVDQYGNAIPYATAVALGLTVLTSDATIVNPASFAVRGSDGAITFNTGATAGKALLTFIIPASGVSASIAFDVAAAGALNAVAVSQPTTLVVAAEKTTISYQAKDQYGASVTLSAGDIGVGANQLYVVSNNPAAVAGISIDASGVMSVQPLAAGTATLSFYFKGALQGQITLDCKAAAVPTKCTGVNASAYTKFVKDAEYTYTFADLTIIDQYNRTMPTATISALAGAAMAVTKNDGAATSFTVAGAKITAAATVGNESVRIAYSATGIGPLYQDVTVSNIAAASIASYKITSPTNTKIFAGAIKTVSVDYGLDASGNKVKVTSAFDALTTSDASVLTADKTTGEITAAAAGPAEGTKATVIGWKNGKLVGSVEFTYSLVAPTVVSVAWTVASLDWDGVNTAILADAAVKVTALDQYGNAIAPGAGTYFSSNTGIATVDTDGDPLTKVAAGTCVITFVKSSNGLYTQLTLNVK